MPRYVRISDVPAILSELQGLGRNTQPYQLNKWQQKWCKISDQPETDAAVLSYRWRIRGRNENIADFKKWLSDCGREGYAVVDMREGPAPVDWTLADGHDIQIEVAAWLLWLYTNRLAEYAWVDQMCVPQDADLEEKMTHIKGSTGIYTAGKVYVMIAPVVDYISGKIMNSQEARSIVQLYSDEMDKYRGARFLGRSAVKALLVNNSYMRRVWTIQEAVAAQNLTVWPLKGEGEVNSYQSIYVVDWPEFNAWNGHPMLGPLYLKFGDEALTDYYDGDYTGIIKLLRAHPVDGIGHLAMISKDLMWITMDRNGLINDLKRADSAARRAFVVLNNHQIQSARSFLPEDRVLALVPLVDYAAWKEATAQVPGRHLVQASVAWAYGIMEAEMATWKWSIRVFNSATCRARGLELLQPRRNLGDTTAMYGATPGWEMQIPTEGGILVLSPPPPHPDPTVATFLAVAAPNPAPLELKVEAALVMPHPGQARNWGGGPWTQVRDALQTDEVFRLSVQWGLEPWRNPALGLDVDRSAVVVVSGGGLAHPAMIIMGIRAEPEEEEEEEKEPSTVEVMEVVDVSSDLLPALLETLRDMALAEITSPLTAVSAGVVPPPPEPPTEPSALGPAWQLVLPPSAEAEPGVGSCLEGEPAAAAAAVQKMEGEVPADPASPAQGEEGAAAPSSRPASAKPASSRPTSAPRPGSSAQQGAPAAAAAPPPSSTPSRPASARPSSAAPSAAGRPGSAAKAPSERPPSARPPLAAAGGSAAAAAAAPSGGDVAAGAGEAPEPPPAGATIHKGVAAPGLPHSGVEVAAGAKYAGQAPVVQGAEGPCKGCILN
ncbi:hypothetical protein PLESTB_001330200 [Pleodorina starrii]|uniref:Heterokaryon incompatibility domain-containing protein n=1 Tax=Pleodorina starrii TaxID=330485 RepID=A0A9W6BTN6_9CHLO|nr:hypothetical protein PLESTM_001626200 [Pleodorina starrii]GLC58204.1 hypothetical protein PLESTB_001330200 [Pleodorina starrii]GLC75528.1 hypothetical protein PLESTF_001653600 [Pleodorina starrii]